MFSSLLGLPFLHLFCFVGLASEVEWGLNEYVDERNGDIFGLVNFNI